LTYEKTGDGGGSTNSGLLLPKKKEKPEKALNKDNSRGEKGFGWRVLPGAGT